MNIASDEYKSRFGKHKTRDKDDHLKYLSRWTETLIYQSGYTNYV